MFTNNWRNDDVGIIYESLLTEIPVGILKSSYNVFKVVYSHINKKSKDLYIIIAIKDNKGIKLITTYPTKKEKRVRTYEYY